MEDPPSLDGRPRGTRAPTVYLTARTEPRNEDNGPCTRGTAGTPIHCQLGKPLPRRLRRGFLARRPVPSRQQARRRGPRLPRRPTQLSDPPPWWWIVQAVDAPLGRPARHVRAHSTEVRALHPQGCLRAASDQHCLPVPPGARVRPGGSRRRSTTGGLPPLRWPTVDPANQPTNDAARYGRPDGTL